MFNFFKDREDEGLVIFLSCNQLMMSSLPKDVSKLSVWGFGKVSLILLSQEGMDIIHCRNHGLPSYSGIGIHHLVNVFHKHFFLISNIYFITSFLLVIFLEQETMQVQQLTKYLWIYIYSWTFLLQSLLLSSAT